MIAQVKISDKLSINCEGETVHDLFSQISQVQETFEDTRCRCCNQTNIKYVHRIVEDNDFYEIQCQNSKCRAKLVFGTSKAEKKLYPKRFETDGKGKAVKDSDGKAVVKGQWGWHIWKPE